MASLKTGVRTLVPCRPLSRREIAGSLVPTRRASSRRDMPTTVRRLGQRVRTGRRHSFRASSVRRLQLPDDSRRHEAPARGPGELAEACPAVVHDADSRSSRSGHDRADSSGDCPASGRGGPVTQVTSRELETLLQLACFHYLTAAQVEAFLFDGSALRPASRARVARRILAGLVQSGFVQPAQRLVSAEGSGPARRVYTLTASGEAVLRRSGRRGGPPPARRGSLFVEHALTTADVALAFRRAARAQPGPAIVSWESDWDLQMAIPGSPLVPDARVVLAADDLKLHAFLEVDRATERPAAFARKIAAYLEWYWSGRWRECVAIWPVVLVVTPTAMRAVSLRRTTETVVARYGSEGTEFRFAALPHLKVGGPFGDVWQIAGRNGLHVLIDAEPAASVADPATA